MIIVSQNGEEVINFKCTHVVRISGRTIRNYFTPENYIVLGEYLTEERAKEVLIEIIQSYINSENYKYVNQLMMNVELKRLQKGLIYEMPKE